MQIFRHRSYPLYLVLGVVSWLISLPYVQCLGDDTFIYMRMIKNFLDFGRIEYNPGEPCYAMTSVTWFMAWTGATALFGNLDAARYVLSSVFHALAFGGVCAIAARIVRNRMAMAIALAAVFLEPFYLRWLWAGWEVSPKIAAAAWAVYALLWAGERERVWTGAVAGLLGGLAFLTRPELLILLPLGIGYLCFRCARGHRMPNMAGYVAGFGLVSLPWAVYAQLTFGWWLPHTVFAKSGKPWSWYDFAKLAGLVLVPYLPLYALTLRSALTRLPGQANKSGFRLTPRRLDTLLVAVFGAGVMGYAVSGSFLEQIKLALFTPFLALAAAAILARMVDSGRFRLPASAAAITVLATLIVSISIQMPWLLRYSYFNPRFRSGEDREFIAFARRVGEMTPPEATIGLWELGVVGYFTDRYMIDFAGLATPELTAYKLRYPPRRVEWDGLFKRMPDYVGRYVQDTGSIPDFIVECVPMGIESTHGAMDRALFGHIYTPVYSHRADRIFMRFQPRDSYTLFVLFQRRGDSPPLEGTPL